jgi:hypothetical protein
MELTTSPKTSAEEEEGESSELLGFEVALDSETAVLLRLKTMLWLALPGLL